jgi:hypothetical protein
MSYEYSFDSGRDAFSRVWNSSSWADSNLVKRLLIEKLDQMRIKQSDFFGKVKELPDIANLKPLWMEESPYPHSIVGTLAGTSTRTITVTGNLFNASPTLINLQKIARVGTVLRYEASGTTAMAIVSAVDSTNPILTVTAESGTSLPSNGASQTWQIVGEPFTDASAANEARMLARKTRFTTTQIFNEVFEILQSRENLAMEIVGNEVEHQIDSLIYKMRQSMAYSIIQMWPYMSGSTVYSAMETERSRLTGLEFWCNNLFASGKEFENSSILKDLSGASVDISDIDTLARTMMLNGSDFGSGDWQIWVHPNVRAYMHDYAISFREKPDTSREAGFLVDKLNLKIGATIGVNDDIYIPERQLYLVDMSKLGYGWYKNDKIHRNEIPMQTSRTKRWQISCQMYGLVVRDAPISLGLIKNIANVS